MTIQTFTTPHDDQHDNADYYRGRADAYDESNTGADPDTLDDRLDWMTDPTIAHTTNQLLSTAYLRGYRALIEDLRAEQHWTRWITDTQYTTWLNSQTSKPADANAA